MLAFDAALGLLFVEQEELDFPAATTMRHASSPLTSRWATGLKWPPLTSIGAR